MKKLCLLLSLGFLFSCQEAIDEIPEVIVEEVASLSLADETEVVEEIEILIECEFEFEEVEIEELVFEEVEEAMEKIRVKLDAKIEEVQEMEIEIVEVLETETEVREILRKN